MVSSAPSLSFVPISIAFGTIDVGTSVAYTSYHIKNKSQSYADAVNMSISFLGSVNSSEVKTESWVVVSTALEETPVTSQAGGKECQAPSVSQGLSTVACAKMVVPAGASTSGTVKFRLHHRYQYTG